MWLWNTGPAGHVYHGVTYRTLCACLAAVSALISSVIEARPADLRSSGPVSIVLLRRSEKKAPDGSGADVLVPAKPAGDDIARRAAAMLTDPAGFGQQALRLDRFVRTYLLRDPTVPAARRLVLTQPAFLFLSDREGGYPANSFWLEQPDGSLREMRDVPFVDTVVRERDLAPGTIDGMVAIYAHELGHLMMAALAGPAPKRASMAMHFVTTRTDAWYAFTEGFGEHFQPLSLDLAGNAGRPAARETEIPELERTWYGRFEREQAEGCVVCPANLRFLYWHGRREQRMRDLPLRTNLFVFKPALPPSLLDDSRSPFDGRLYRDLAAPSATAPPKNGVQMMESEGVIATLFYRLVTDERLGQTYREAAFYEPFLDERQAAALHEWGPRAVVSPVENVYLKLFDTMHRSLAWGAWPAIELVSGYATRFPDEALAVYDVFLDATRGVTADREAASKHGAPGFLSGLGGRLVSREIAIDGNLGPALWMLSPSMTFGMGVFRYVPFPNSFTFDLNAADVPDLRSVPGVSAPLAAAVIRARDERGYFSRVRDLADVPGVTPSLLEQFERMAAKMDTRMKKSSARTADAGWIKDLLVPLLRASYYAAAAWQLGVALVLAGIAFATTGWVARRALVAWVSGQRPASAQPELHGWRHWWSRGWRGLSRGIAGATAPCAASVTLYAAGILPTVPNMVAVGLALGCGWALVRMSLPGSAQTRPAVLVAFIGAMAAASAVIGAMY
jgi:hypothetical protein